MTRSFGALASCARTAARTTVSALGGARRGLDKVGGLTRDWVRHMTLGGRILAVLLSVAAASTVATILLQENSLATDLRAAAQVRLDRARDGAHKLITAHLDHLLKRCLTVASSPQLLANLETSHAPTIALFCESLASRLETAAVAIKGAEGEPAAGFGATGLLQTLSAMLGPERRRGVELRLHEDSLFAVAMVPIEDGERVLGRLVAAERISDAQIQEWSSLCQASIATRNDGAVDADDLARSVWPLGRSCLGVTGSFEAEQAALANSRRNLLLGGMIALGLVSLASIFLARGLVRPIREIQEATMRIRSGELDFRIGGDRCDEVGDVARAFDSMLDELEDNIKNRMQAENEISHLAFHDSLTGLPNRRMLCDRLTASLAQGAAKGVAVIFMDLDRFKSVNDTLGHTVGDELLLAVAERLGDCITALGERGDIDDEDVLLARLGGDEFTLLLTEIRSRALVEELAEMIVATMSKPFELAGREVAVGASLGIALAPEDAADVETLLRGSDMAMFHAKSQGGRGYAFYADSMEEVASRRLELEQKLHRALEQGDFHVLYQPKVDLKSGAITGFEALLRWEDETLGLVNPVDFIPMAEETGVIIPVGEWVLRHAVQQALAWQREGLPAVKMAVNVSVRQIEHRDDFAQMVVRVLEETGLEPQYLELEITEGALLKDEDSAIALFERLRALGVGLSLDDFGTGYSSLSYLRRLPIDTLKLDKSFLDGSEDDVEAALLVGSIIGMAKVLGLRVVVEGVETHKQRKFLTELGCDELQGFLFSRPVSAEAAAKLLVETPRNRRRGGRRADDVEPSCSS